VRKQVGQQVWLGDEYLTSECIQGNQIFIWVLLGQVKK
jgi:hypothetical protein